MNILKIFSKYYTLLVIILPPSFSLITPTIYNNDNILLAKKHKSYDDQLYDDLYEPIVTKPTFKYKFKPKTTLQKEYFQDIIDDNLKLVIASGPAGTGKTLFPTQYAAKLLIETDMKIVVTRPLICVDEELGYLPGNINKKMDPWIIPIFDIFREFFSQKDINNFIGEKRLEIVPLAFMRGRTFKNTFVIGDELQNSSNNQMLMLLTRLGDDSKMVITGDINQCDNNQNGLKDLLYRINDTYNESSEYTLKENLISLIELQNSDIQRSPIVEVILKLYD